MAFSFTEGERHAHVVPALWPGRFDVRGPNPHGSRIVAFAHEEADAAGMPRLAFVPRRPRDDHLETPDLPQPRFMRKPRRNGWFAWHFDPVGNLFGN